MFNLVNLGDARSIVPIALLALAGVAAYFLWTRAQANNAAANASAYDASAASAPNTGQLANLALLSSLFGGSQAAPAGGQPTYSAPAATGTGSNAQTQVQTIAPLGSGSSVGNTPVTQGV